MKKKQIVKNHIWSILKPGSLFGDIELTSIFHELDRNSTAEEISAIEKRHRRLRTARAQTHVVCWVIDKRFFYRQLGGSYALSRQLLAKA